MPGLPLLPSLLSKIPGLLLGPVTQFFTGINISQVLGSIISFIQLAIKHWKISLIVLLSIANLISGYEYKHDHSALIKEKISHQQDIKNFKQAQVDATNQANSEKQQVINESKIKANEADKKYDDLLKQFNANIVRYKANSSSGGQSTDQRNNPSGQVTQGSDGPSGSTDLLTITLKDARICADNTARLLAAHDWAINLGKGTDDNVQH